MVIKEKEDAMTFFVMIVLFIVFVRMAVSLFNKSKAPAGSIESDAASFASFMDGVKVDTPRKSSFSESRKRYNESTDFTSYVNPTTCSRIVNGVDSFGMSC